MYTSIVIDNKVAMNHFYTVYDAQAKREKGSPSSLALQLFEIIWNAEDKNNDFDKPEQKSC